MPRNALPLKDKVRLLNTDSKNIYSRHQLAEKFGVGKTQLYRIINDRDNIMRLYNKNRINDEFRRLDHIRGIHFVLDQSLLDWFKRLRDRQVHVTGPMIKNTALQMAAFLGIDNFKASNGWLHGFNKKYKISLARKPGKVGRTAPRLMTKWKCKIIDLINEYDARDVYALDEVGIFLWALPNQVSDLKNMTCSVGEMSEERATVLLCANMRGEKENPLMISSICKDFEGTDDLSSVVEWQYEQRSFLTETIMTGWLTRFDRKMGSQGRRVVLFLDHAQSHQFVKMDNINLVFVHPNFTPNWDPMEQGVIQNLKLKYRKRVLQHVIETLTVTEFIGQESISDVRKALEWISSAWNDITADAIRNAFVRSGFPVKQNHAGIELTPVNEDLTDYIQLCGELGIVHDDALKKCDLIDKNLAVEAVSDDVIDIVKHQLFLSSTNSKIAKETESTESSADACEGILNAEGCRENQNGDEPTKVPGDEFEGVINTEGSRRELEEFLIFK